MKFEHVLQIYWSKGFLTNGKLQPFHVSFNDMFKVPGGFSWPMKRLLIERLESQKLGRRPNVNLSDLGQWVVPGLNLFFSQITSVNNTVFELTRYNMLRLYLVKTTRGRSHALGKPSRGQRTWSNAWSAYHTNKITRSFIGEYQKLKAKDAKEEKINYKLIKRKSLRKVRKETVSKVKTRINNWF